MFYALSWFVVVSLVVLWSLAAWALHAVAVWAVSHAGALSAATSGTGALAMPDWLAPWVPPELASWTGPLLSSVAAVLDGLFQAMPALAGLLTVLSWGLWGLGTVLLVLAGLGLHLLIAFWRSRGRAPGPHAGSSPLAAS